MLSQSWVPTVQGSACWVSRQRQQGVVLMIALIVLVVLTLGGLALMRSVSTTSVIAGNLAFQQAATASGEAGSEAAIRSIEAGNVTAMSATQLQNDNFARGYAASVVDPADWETYWNTTIDPSPKSRPVSSANAGCGHGGGRACTLATDSAGNTVSYTIQRLCRNSGAPGLTATGCANGSPQSSLEGNSKSVGSTLVPPLIQNYYRVTSRIVGPRNTVSYVQTIIAR